MIWLFKHLASGVAVGAIAACTAAPPAGFAGYVEGESVRLAAPISGTLTRLHVQRGDAVAASAPAFVLEQDSERAAREEAQARLRRAEQQLGNLQAGKRPDEIAALRAQLAQAQAALNLSTRELTRANELVAQNFTSPASLDAARAAVARDQARVNELNAQLRLAGQGGRVQEIGAAQQEVLAARAQLAQAEWRVQQKTQRMPAAGQVTDVLYREGEWVPQGSPVLTLLPPSQVKARFFVPEPVLGRLQLGQAVTLHCDGCPAPITAKVSYIAREAEFTSPLIYSKENRAALVFMVEARPSADDARRLHPGQPLEVRQ
ncbi:HlyD family secretion protein [Piscinibacter gummiphilus]|uniref:HlyD family efflux transporter periplasmic adaptor subunit n=1 Tax=Piscinibacter gummiphilus TaxID=946333 RepID=A0ABZ0CVW5_9BURK|nr:HlyD family efflux transporter periplasmic adaptor subunit [Piscinibacter gummiphilus]WOB09115.1 HlyD family efflux transporter periplasmic adaptor subunit [Piscinibacter gummiphilus]